MQHRPLNVAMVAPFPPKDAIHGRLRGTASYTRNLVAHLCVDPHKARVKVFANYLGHPEATKRLPEFVPINAEITEVFSSERNCEVLRCWSECAFYPLQIFGKIWSCRTEIDIIHIQHEYAQFGKSLSALLFPFLLGLLHLTRKPIIVTLHGIVEGNAVDSSFRNQHFLKVSLPFLRLGFNFIGRWTGRLACSLIVHEEHTKRILQENYHLAEDKIEVIPHGVEIRKDTLETGTAKRILGVENRRVILFFGYLARYKGLEILIEALGLLSANRHVLLIAGAQVHHLQADPLYIEYLARLKQAADNTQNDAVFSGFVPEERISLYFSAADLVVFPYVDMHACSGPFCLALSYKRPFLVSEAFADFYGLPSELRFRHTAESLGGKIEEFFESESLGSIAGEWTEKFIRQRLWSSVANRTQEVYAKIHSGLADASER